MGLQTGQGRLSCQALGQEDRRQSPSENDVMAVAMRLCAHMLHQQGPSRGRWDTAEPGRPGEGGKTDGDDEGLDGGGGSAQGSL